MAPPRRKRRENYQHPPESEHELAHGEEEISDAAELQALGVEFDQALKAYLEETEEKLPPPSRLAKLRGRGLEREKISPPAQHATFDFFSRLSSYPEICMELATNLKIRQFIALYSISKDFHEIINGHLMHIMKRCAQKNAPDSAKLYPFPLYGSLCVPDPVGRTIPEKPDEVRKVPSLKWLQMIYHRERAVRDILALLAREGHRCPKGMALSLKKMWLTMDLSTSIRRAQLFHNEDVWTDVDIYNIQLFAIKLDMRFNDPINGPGDDGLRRLLFGQRGLSPIWRTLRRESLRNGLELAAMAIRYCHYNPAEQHLEKTSILGIPVEEIGKGHLEGWGKGRIHLYRPDELVMRESLRRGLDLTVHLMPMMLWGYVDPVTHKDIEVSEEEMYMSDDDPEEGGKPWSDRKKTGWKEPEPMEKLPNMDEEEEGEGEINDDEEWMTDDEEDEDGNSMEEEEEDGEGGGEGDQMDLDGSDEESDEGMDEEFLRSMDVDDAGNLLNP